MHTFSRYLAICFAWVLGIAETLAFLTSNEYWPLALDNYLAVALMLGCVRFARFQQGVVILTAGWAFVVGNFYALLFSITESETSAMIRITAISIGLGIALIGLCASLIASKYFFNGNKHIV